MGFTSWHPVLMPDADGQTLVVSHTPDGSWSRCIRPLLAWFAVRRRQLERAGVQVPVLATVVLGGLPQPGNWAVRLERLGLDVVSTGALEDTPEGFLAAVAAVPHRPVLARAGDIAALDGAGARMIATSDAVRGGVYALGPNDSAIVAVSADTPPESTDDVGRSVLKAARAGTPAAMWVAAPDLSGVPDAIVEAKLAALVGGARIARLWLAKEQFDRD